MTSLGDEDDIEIRFLNGRHHHGDDDDEDTSRDKKQTYTVEEAVEELGIGWFQVRLFVITGLFSVCRKSKVLKKHTPKRHQFIHEKIYVCRFIHNVTPGSVS